MTKFLKFLSIFGPGRHAMSVGPKLGHLGRKWATIVTDAASLSHLDSDHASNTFLVLGPIDLTNGMAGVVGSFAIHAARDKTAKVYKKVKKI
jgi:hypothetical protein